MVRGIKMTDWSKIEILVKKLSEQTNICHTKLYGEMLNLEESLFDKYLLNKKNNNAKFVDSFYYSAIGQLSNKYRRLLK